MAYPTSMLQAISLPMLQGMMMTPPGSSPALTPAGGLSHPSMLGVPSGPAQLVFRRRRLITFAAVSAGGLLLGTLAVFALRQPVVVPPPTATISTGTTAPPAKPRQVRWSLSSSPKGALIIRAADEHVLGTTPWVAERPAGDGLLDVKLRIAGYVDRSLKLNLAADETREEQLDAVAKPKPPIRPPVRPPGRWPFGRSPGGNPKKNDNDAPRIVD